MTRINIFNDRIRNFASQADHYRKISNKYSLARTVLFIVGLVTIIYFANERYYLGFLIILITFPAFFAILVKKHNKVKSGKEEADLKVSVNKDEIARLNHEFHYLDSGNEFIDDLHPYTSDLDIFGKNSLFQLINRTSTSHGKIMLADWMRKKTIGEKINQRQEATKELSPQIDWRQDFQVKGIHKKENEEAIKVLMDWIKNPSEIKGDLKYQLARFILPPVLLIGLGFFIFDLVPLTVFLILLAINGAALYSLNKYASDTTEKTYLSISGLKAYTALIRLIETTSFKSEYLNGLKNNFDHQDIIASEQIKKLTAILENLQARANAIYALFNLVFLLDIHWLVASEKWKEKNGGEVKSWIAAISELEAVNSISGFNFANPDYNFPLLTNDKFILEAKEIGHPLIPSDERVNNDFELEGSGTIAIITGSNMSGKSTFLRTVGINSVLAMMGGPVCAEKMKLSSYQVFTSMRNQDNLEENISSFYAELRRIRQLLDIIEGEDQVLYLLDEILKGTNSQDRHKGAASLIHQLSNLNGFGLVSTHDLELGSMENEVPSIYNYSFDSQIEKDEIYFDYKLKKGLCKSFNASELMKKMGIKIKN